MNHREPPQVPQGMRRAGNYLGLLFVFAVQGMLPAAAHPRTAGDWAPNVSATASGGYLATHGAPPLRFAEIFVPANPPAQLAVATPSKPVPAATHSTGAAPHATDSTVTALPTAHPGQPVDANPNPSAPDKSAPLSILPDEARPQVRPEDFLPFFQVPGSGRNPDVTVMAPVSLEPPASAPQPPSSATYLQTPK